CTRVECSGGVCYVEDGPHYFDYW
nr:immunoglobulin heavy chain junction region [Macaca mulatta]